MLRMPPDDLADLPVVTDYAEIPLDGFHQDDEGRWVDEEEADGDNSVLAFARYLQGPVAQQLGAGNEPRRAQAKVVGPLRRELRPQGRRRPLQGRDVVAVHRALSRAGVATWKPGGAFSPIAGPYFYRSIKKFQRKAGLVADGVYGNATHRALARHFDSYGIRVYQTAKIGLKGSELKRQKFRAQALYLVHNRDRVGYTMGASRMTIVRRNLQIGDLFRHGAIWEDCSSSLRGLFKLAGHKDIMGFGYNHPWGFTGTMTNTGFPITANRSNLKIGDCFLTGRNPWVHTWAYIGSGVAFSHGKMSDPRIVPWNYRPVSHCQRFIEEE